MKQVKMVVVEQKDWLRKFTFEGGSEGEKTIEEMLNIKAVETANGVIFRWEDNDNLTIVRGKQLGDGLVLLTHETSWRDEELTSRYLLVQF